MKFIITLELDEDGGYVVECPNLPGCVSHGATIDEAKRNIADAIRVSLATRHDLGLPEYVEVSEPEAVT